MNETILWFKDMHSHEYHVTLKHNYVKGARGALFSLMKNTILGLFLPLAVFIILKRYGHGHAQYFNAKVLNCIYFLVCHYAWSSRLR